ncbi:MAG: hypothetical protein AAB650_00970 [Patescibacteria group bacterium]
MQFHEYRFHEDDRRKGRYDIVSGLVGEMNFSVHPAGVVPEEWHMHKIHTDYFTVAKGRALFRLLYEDGREEKIILSERDAKTLIVPPGVWHNYTALEPTIMIFYIDRKFDAADEFRKPCDADGWSVDR